MKARVRGLTRFGRVIRLSGVVALCGVACADAGGQSIHLVQLHSPPGCLALPRALSGDGTFLAGHGCPGPWHWTEGGGYQNYPGENGFYIHDVDLTGAVVVGEAVFPGLSISTQASYWVTSLGFPQNPGLIPGYLYSTAAGISNDASIIVGWAQNEVGTNPPFVAVRWAAGGFTLLPPAPGQVRSRRATCISGDGQWIWGTSTTNLNSMPTRWGPGGAAQSMGLPPGELNEAIPIRASTDGSAVMGYGPQVHTWRWIDGLGYLSIASPPGTTARPQDMTEGGNAIVGTVFVNFTPSYAAFWTQSGQWINLNTYLPTQGLNLSGWQLTSCTAVSDDGRVLAGTGFYNGQAAAWAITGIRSICGARIQSQTLATSKCSGQSAEITVFAVPPSSPGAVQYQWYRRYYLPFFPYENNVQLVDGPTGYGSTISGANVPNLFINNVRLQDAGDYWCELFAGCTSVNTNLATLSVLPDLSGNGGTIDTNDLTVLLGNFGATVTPWTSGDLNGDGVVNTLDLTIFLGAFGTTCP